MTFVFVAAVSSIHCKDGKCCCFVCHGKKVGGNHWDFFTLQEESAAAFTRVAGSVGISKRTESQNDLIIVSSPVESLVKVKALAGCRAWVFEMIDSPFIWSLAPP
jgi:hypothetical protein